MRYAIYTRYARYSRYTISDGMLNNILLVMIILFMIMLVIKPSSGAFGKEYKEVPLTYYSERTPAAQGSAVTDAYFLAKIPLDEEGKEARYALLPSAKKDILSRKVRYIDGGLYIYNADGTLNAQLPGIKTTADKDAAARDAKNTVIVTQNEKGETVEKLYADDSGRTLRVLHQKEKVTSLFYEPDEKKTMPITPDAAEYVMEQQPDTGLALLELYGKTNPSFFSTVKKDGRLTDAKAGMDGVDYELSGDVLVASKQRNNVRWGTRTAPDGKQERTINGNSIDSDLATALEQAYGDEITGFDGRTATAGGKRIVVGDNSAKVFMGGNELEQITVITEDGIKKTAISSNPAKEGYAQREVKWKDEKGTHKRTEKNEHGIPVKADEELIDGKGNKYYIRTDFANGKPSVSTIYDTSGYPVGRMRYDENGKPIPEQSTKIEYVNKLGKVCDPTRDYTCPYQQVDMRIMVGNTIISDACRQGDKNCRTLKDCTSDAACEKAYGETLRAFQRANLGVALNNAYLAARAAEVFNVKNFEFTEKLFASEFGQMLFGEPSFGYCGTFSKRTASQEGVLIADTQLKTLIAYVAGSRSTLMHPNRTKEYLYKLNYLVDAQLEDITFNVGLYNGDAMVLSLLIQDAKVPKGQTAGARGKDSIVQYSRNFYDKLCLRSSKGVTCNRIIDVTELSPLPETTAVQPSQMAGGFRVI